MAFIKDRSEQRGERKRWPNKYVRLDEGKPVTIQILEDEAKEYFKFWLKDGNGKNISYVSPGYNICPITQRNISVGKDSSQYIRPQHRCAVNVWDTTPMIRCAECEEPHRPDNLGNGECTNCGASLNGIEPAPYNELRILERGPQLFDQLSGLAGDEDKGIPPQVMAPDGTRLKITQYPITIIRSGTSRNTVYSVIPLPGSADTVDPAKVGDFHDLPDLGLDLSAEEALAIVDDGVPLSEIFAARRGNIEAETPNEDDVLY